MRYMYLLVPGVVPTELPSLARSLLMSHMVLACHAVDVGHSLPIQGVVVARTSDRLGAGGNRATSLAEVGMQSMDRRVEDTWGLRQRLMDL